MRRHVETELSFALPAERRDALRRALHARGAVVHEARLVATLYDTPDRRLARAGLAWRMRREGRRWVQALKQGSGLERFEHEVACPGPEPDPRRHQGTAPGDSLIELLRRARDEGVEATVRSRVEVRRSSRRLRMGAALVEVSLDEGRIVAGGAIEPVCEVEFELVDGPVGAMLAGARRWSARHGLTLLAETKAERGDRLAEGHAAPPVARVQPPAYAPSAGTAQAFGAVVDACFGQVLRNAAGLLHPAAGDTAERVHQLRVGVRRLRSALRLFDGIVPASAMPPSALVDALRRTFDELGAVRDREVQASGIAAALAAAGAPDVRFEPLPETRGPAAIVGAAAVQAMLLGWVTWRTTLAHGEHATADADDAGHPPEDWTALAHRRLRRWQRRVAADAARWGDLDEAARHRLRRRVKRLRYAAEFLWPVLRRRPLRRLLRALEPAQARLGERHDLVVAREAYAAVLPQQPAAAFALGFIAARLEARQPAAGRALARVAKARLPGRRRRLCRKAGDRPPAA